MQAEHPMVGEILTSKVSQNRQLYGNSELKNDPLTMEYLGGSQQFAGDKDPNLAILVEKPEHRIIMFLRAQGKSAMEVSKATGYSYQWVLQICRQPWFKKRLLETIKEAGEDGVTAFIQGEVLPSLMVLAEIRDDPKSKDATRVSACNSILDRGLGKAVQHIKTEQVKTTEDVKGEMSAIERELEQIRLQQKSCGLTPPGRSN